MGDSSKVQIILLVLLFQVFLTYLPQVHGRPGKLYNTPETVKQTGCTSKPEIDELCQQCAKHTKSNLVYPMCCEDSEAAQDFCKRYLDFGLH